MYRIEKHCKKPRFKITVYGHENVLIAYYYPSMLAAFYGYFLVFKRYSRYSGTDIVLKRVLNKEDWEE